MQEPSDLSAVRSLLDGPAPAVLATHRKDGSVKLSPVWFRQEGDYFDVVIADDDVKLKHIRVVVRIPVRLAKVWDLAAITT